MNAPFCPISKTQSPVNPQGLPTKLPSIPLATDLPSLIRSVNIMRDILRTLTTSLTVNNTYLPREQQQRRMPVKTYLMSTYPDWSQTRTSTKEGFVYHKDKSGKDEDQRASVSRTDEVEFRQKFIDNDKSLLWRYVIPLDAPGGDPGEAPLFEEDFFERIVNVNFANMGTEIKPGGRVLTTDLGSADSSTILISMMVRIPQSTIEAAGHNAIPLLMFGKYIPPSKKTIQPPPRMEDSGYAVIHIDFLFYDVGSTGYNLKWRYFGGTEWAVLGGPPQTPVEGALTHFTGAFYPSWDFGDHDTPSSYMTDDKPNPPGSPSGTRYGTDVEPGTYTSRITGASISSTLVARDWYGGNPGDFWVGSYWTYKLGPVAMPVDPYEVNVSETRPSVLSYAGNQVHLEVSGRSDRPVEGDRWYSGTRSKGTDVKIDKWNHILISGDLHKEWSITINGDPNYKDTSEGSPNFTGIALSGLEFGVPMIPSAEVLNWIPFDVEYIGLRVWFGGTYVDAHDPAVIALFVDANKKPRRAELANKQFGLPDVWLDKGAKSFIKNKGTAGDFHATGFSNGKEGLIINYKPYPKFVGVKDTSKPSPANK